MSDTFGNQFISMGQASILLGHAINNQSKLIEQPSRNKCSQIQSRDEILQLTKHRFHSKKISNIEKIDNLLRKSKS